MDIPKEFPDAIRKLTDQQVVAKYGWKMHRVRAWRRHLNIQPEDRDHDWGRNAMCQGEKAFIERHWEELGPTRLAQVLTQKAQEKRQYATRVINRQQVSRYARLKGLAYLAAGRPPVVPVTESKAVTWRCQVVGCGRLNQGHYGKCSGSHAGL